MRSLLLPPMILIALCTGLFFSGYGFLVHDHFRSGITRCIYFDGIGTKFAYLIDPPAGRLPTAPGSPSPCSVADTQIVSARL
jgi:hypothetical protein